MNEMNHERFEDLKDAYALGALPEDELRAFEEHLANHPELQSEVDDLTSIAALLAISPANHEPPKRLRKSLMAIVNAESGSRRERRVAAPRWSPFDNLRNLFTPKFVLGAAAALVVGLLSWNVLLQSEMNDLSGQNTALQAEIEDMSGGADESRVLAMQTEGEMSGSDVELMSFEGDKNVLVARSTPALPEGETFQIWVIDDGEAQPSGLFQPGESPVAAVVESSLEGAETVAVTVEPAGGSPQPTTEPMISVQL